MRYALRVSIVILLSYLALAAQAPGTPANFKATSASSKQVVLSWTAGSNAATYVVERRPLGGDYSALTPVPTITTFTDTTFDVYTTYSYRVSSRSAAGVASATSSEIQIGPPPIGFNVAVHTPNIAPDPSTYGQKLWLTLDANGDPVIAYLHQDPNADNDSSDTILYFVGWDRANYKWRDPLKVDVPGTIDAGGAVFPLSIACDISTGRLGIFYEKSGFRLAVAFSTDNGVTWTIQSVATSGIQEEQEPSLQMAGGQVYLTYAEDTTGYLYFTGSETAAPSTWTKTNIPLPSGSSGFRNIAHLALDSAGKPGVAFIFDENSGPSIGFWRPGSATSTRVVAIKFSNDDPDIRLAFFGTQPRIIFAGGFNNQVYDYNAQLWVMTSSDSVTWTAPVAMPNDGHAAWGPTISLAIKSTGFATALAQYNGGNDGGVKCGFPKWTQSSDLVIWTTCSPQGGNPPSTSAQYPSAIYAANDKIYVAFQNIDGSTNLPTGVILYREPISQGAIQPPQLQSNSAVNGASFTAGVAPGSIFSIFGQNLAVSPSNSNSVPLPTTLASTSVSVAGKQAPLYYVSPTQINAQVPFETPVGSATVTVTVNGQQSGPATLNVGNSAPGVFLYGANHAVAQHNPDLSIDSPDNPSKVGSVITIFATGQGPVNTTVASGAAAPGSEPLARASLLTTCTIGGKDALVSFAGLTPGLVGLLQVNVTVPVLAKGDYPLVLTIGGVASNAGTMSVTP